MKLSDYIIQFLAERGVTHFYGMSGGAAVHLFDSIARNPATSYVCVNHEQTAALAADGFARATGKLGVALTTSGPGATNLLTGTCSSYYDSVPTLMLTGQVATYRLKGRIPVRQIGFQETDVVSIFQTVTKYAVQITDPKTIRFHLEKAYHLAFAGRPGPVLLDIPDDLQRMQIDPDELAAFQPENDKVAATPAHDLEELNQLLAAAQRPVLILGGGLKTPPVSKELIEQFVTRLNVPVLLTWAGLDLLSAGHPLWAGPFGVYGPRPGNFAIQNADLVLCIGSRLSQNVTGGLLHTFAREAKIVMVDVDAGEMDKFSGRGIHIHRKIQSRAEDFLRAAGLLLLPFSPERLAPWRQRIQDWQSALGIDAESRSAAPKGSLDAYEFIRLLSASAAEDELIFVDTGGNLTWTCNSWKTRGLQRIHSAWNNTPMGYALPAALGAAFSRRPQSTTCLIGDGGLMLCLGELATVKYHQLPLRIFLFNNHCHGIQRQTLETWFEGRYEAVDPASGLAFADFVRVAKAMDLPVITLDEMSQAPQQLQEIYRMSGPVFINVEINPNQKLYPVLKFGAALENQLPSLAPEIIAANMVIKPFPG